jgi:hypothetical protein
VKKPVNATAARKRKQKEIERKRYIACQSNMRKNNTQKPKVNPKYSRLLGGVFDLLRRKK